MKSIEIKKALESITGLTLSVGTLRAKNPFIVVRTACRSAFPASLRAACIARVYPGRKVTDECPASYGNIEVASIAMKANEWADVLVKVQSTEFRTGLAIQECIDAQRSANFERVFNEVILPAHPVPFWGAI